jgi:hypothetical protein
MIYLSIIKDWKLLLILIIKILRSKSEISSEISILIELLDLKEIIIFIFIEIHNFFDINNYFQIINISNNIFSLLRIIIIIIGDIRDTINNPGKLF